MRRLLSIILISCLFLSVVVGCNKTPVFSSKLKKVGLLVSDTINDPIWGSKGYEGLLKIQSNLKTDVYYQEGVKTKKVAEDAIKNFDENGVNLVFGHGSEFGKFFEEIAKKYPHIQFVYFNGDYSSENVTSLNFASEAMGFFGGMVASKMSKSKKIAVIAAFDWQPEVKGFIEGAKYQDANTIVSVHYTNDWYGENNALMALEKMKNDGVDVVYPAGDAYNIPVIKKMKEYGLYVIGFVSDQSDLGEATVLTSTVQHVDKLYVLAARQFSKGELPSESTYYDFQDDVISMGKFGKDVPEEFQQQIMEAIEVYKKTGSLPVK